MSNTTLPWQWRHYQHAEALTQIGTYQICLDTGDLWVVFFRSEIVADGILDLQEAANIAEDNFLNNF